MKTRGGGYFPHVLLTVLSPMASVSSTESILKEHKRNPLPFMVSLGSHKRPFLAKSGKHGKV